MNPPAALILLRKDFLRFRRDRGALVMAFLLPLTMIYLFGQIYGVNRPNRGPSAVPVAVVAENGGADAPALLQALRARPAFHIVPAREADLPAGMRQGRYHYAVVLLPDRVRLVTDPANALEAELVTGLLERTLYATAAARGDPAWLAQLPRIDRVEAAPALPHGSPRGNPLAAQLVGGWAIQFLLFALVWSATSLFEEKDQGLFHRMLAGPLPPSAILWSKFLYGVCLGGGQLLLLFVAGRWLFGIALLPYLPLLVPVCFLAAAACSAFGMLLASLANTLEMARGLSTFCILLMSALGGAWFPISFMPPFMQHLSRFTPVYWAIDGFLRVLWQHAPWAELLPTFGVLAAFASVFLALAWSRFARGGLFD